jgi:hypothetical protein
MRLAAKKGDDVANGIIEDIFKSSEYMPPTSGLGLEWTADMFLTNNPSIQKFYCFLK